MAAMISRCSAASTTPEPLASRLAEIAARMARDTLSEWGPGALGCGTAITACIAADRDLGARRPARPAHRPHRSRVAQHQRHRGAGKPFRRRSISSNQGWHAEGLSATSESVVSMGWRRRSSASSPPPPTRPHPATARSSSWIVRHRFRLSAEEPVVPIRQHLRSACAMPIRASLHRHRHRCTLEQRAWPRFRPGAWHTTIALNPEQRR